MLEKEAGYQINTYKKQLDLGFVTLNYHIVEFGDMDSEEVIGITCGVHGNECSMVSIVYDMLERLKKVHFRGKLKIFLCANPLADLLNQRNCPIDDVDLNRAGMNMPESFVSKASFKILSEEMREVKYFIDVHEYQMDSVIQALVIENDQDEVPEPTKDLVAKLNSDVVIYLDKRYQVSLSGYLQRVYHIASVALELSPRMCNDEQKRNEIITMFLNFMSEIQLIDELTIDIQKKEPKEIRSMDSIFCPFTGVVKMLKPVGSLLEEGEEYGKIISIDFNEEVVLKAKHTSILLSMQSDVVVNQGVLLARLGGV